MATTFGLSKSGQVARAWDNARRAAAQQFLADSQALGSALSNAFTNQIQGQAKLAAQAALKRVQAATKAKLAEADKLKIDKKV